MAPIDLLHATRPSHLLHHFGKPGQVLRSRNHLSNSLVRINDKPVGHVLAIVLARQDKKQEVKKPEAASLFDAPGVISATGRAAGRIPDANQLESGDGDEPAEPDEADDEQENVQNQSGSPVLSHAACASVE